MAATEAGEAGIEGLLNAHRMTPGVHDRRHARAGSARPAEPAADEDRSSSRSPRPRRTRVLVAPGGCRVAARRTGSPERRPGRITSPGRSTPGGGGTRSRWWWTSRGRGGPGCRRRTAAEEPLLDRADDGGEVPALEGGVPGPPGNRVSPERSRGVPSTAKHIDPGVWPGVAMSGCGAGPSRGPCRPRGAGRRRGASGVLGRHRHGDARLPHGRDRLDVVPVAVGLHHAAHPERWQTSSSSSCSLATSTKRASPVRRQRTM